MTPDQHATTAPLYYFKSAKACFEGLVANCLIRSPCEVIFVIETGGTKCSPVDALITKCQSLLKR